MCVVAMSMSICNVDAYAKTVSCTAKESDTDYDTSKSTYGELTDSTKLTIKFNDSWWYSKASVKSDGVSEVTFNKKNTKYTMYVTSHKITTYMAGIGFEVSCSDATGSINDNVAVFECDDAYFSYTIRSYARCWTGTYEQESSAKYKLMLSEKSNGTVLLNTKLEW